MVVGEQLFLWVAQEKDTQGLLESKHESLTSWGALNLKELEVHIKDMTPLERVLGNVVTFRRTIQVG